MKLFNFFKNNKTKRAPEEKFENLSMTQEMLTCLFDSNTLKAAKNQMGNKGKISPIDKNNMNFRLFTADDGNVNLELLAQNQMGMYFKPIGFFDNKNGEITVTILKEFESDYEKLKSKIKSSISVNILTLKENAFIAAASSDIVSIVKNMINSPKYERDMPLSTENMQFQKANINGLTISVRSSMMGALETNLEDNDYELEDSLLVMYQNINGISLHSTDSEFNEMQSKSLLSAFKTI